MRRAPTALSAFILLVGLPLLSASLAGFPRGFAELPPQTVYIETPEFSAPLYAILLLFAVLVALLLITPRWFAFAARGQSDFAGLSWSFEPRSGSHFPRWGWLGLALIAVSWPAAWLRPQWLGLAVDHLFFPLWLGYILTADALVYLRAGASPLIRFRLLWLAWFPASALTWWYYELLNRFIQNWLYLGVDHFSALRYVAGATLAFSTVIPAVVTTAALLSTGSFFRRRFVRETATEPPAGVWTILLTLGAVGMVLMPWFPIALFAVIWISPLLILVAVLESRGTATGIGHLLRGDWGPALTLACAALVCGFFWELWNSYAMPKWIYQVPWLNRFRLFEMPLVGYLGYLPFGVACWSFCVLLLPACGRNAR